MHRRDVIKGIGAGVAAPVIIPASALAQGAKDFPNKPITFILPWGPGTGLDIWHRA